MNTDELKKMLKNSTAVLILDNGEPSFVILGYDSYKNLLAEQDKEIKINHSGNGHPNPLKVQGPNNNSDNKLQSSSTRFQHRISEKETEFLEKINKEILALKNEIEKEERSAEVAAID